MLRERKQSAKSFRKRHSIYLSLVPSELKTNIVTGMVEHVVTADGVHESSTCATRPLALQLGQQPVRSAGLSRAKAPAGFFLVTAFNESRCYVMNPDVAGGLLDIV